MAVPTASAVSVLVIDCTSTGASPPTHTLRSPLAMSTLRLKRRAWGPEGIAMLEEDICCWSRFIVAGEGKRGRAYFKLSRATAPLVAGKGSAAPRRVAVTPSGLPTTRVTGSVISTDSVLPAFSKRDNRGAPLARRTSTQESALTVSTRVLAPGAAAAAATVGSAAGAAWPAAGEPGVTALGGGTEIRGTEGFCKFGAGAAAWGTVVCGTVVNGAATVPVVVDAGAAALLAVVVSLFAVSFDTHPKCQAAAPAPASTTMARMGMMGKEARLPWLGKRTSENEAGLPWRRLVWVASLGPGASRAILATSGAGSRRTILA